MNKQKRNVKNAILKLLTVLIVIVLVVYLVYNTVRLIMRPAETFVVEQGKLNVAEIVDAYVIRDEIVLQGANYKNGMDKVVAEGKRVAKDEPVFRYYVNGEETIKKEIAELDRQIAEAQKGENEIYNTDIEILKNKIKDLEEKIYTTNNIEEIENYKKEIDDYTYKISTIVGEQSQPGSYLKELIDKKTNYLNKLTVGAEEIKTNVSGTISYRVDNLEEVFTTGDFNYLTESFLNGLDLKTGELIETSNEKGKLITEFYCYLAVKMDSDAAMNAKLGDKVKIELDAEMVATAEVVKINEEEKGRIIIFKINDLPEKLINYRKLSVNVVWWEFSGLKVPNSALIKENDKYYVERNRAGYSVKVLVKVLKQNDSYAIVDNYTTQELQDMGYSYNEIQNMYAIKQYDKIEIKK